MRRTTDYAQLADAYDTRYRDHRYAGTESTLRAFVSEGQRVLEVGCGTGHWIARLESWGCDVAGVEPEPKMLARALARGLRAELREARAEALPFPDQSFDRVLCVNAIHHFADALRFAHEARRVLRRGGRVLSIALDPNARQDTWFVYDYFPETWPLDLARYPATETLRGWLADAGFARCESYVAEHMTVDFSARELLDQGKITPAATSQLALISAQQLSAGIARIRDATEAAEARGEALRLRGDLRLFATTGDVP